MLRRTTAWFAVWAAAFYMALLGYVLEAQGQTLTALVAAAVVLGIMARLILDALEPKS